MENLAQKKCKACEGGVPALSQNGAEELIKFLNGWKLHALRISKEFTFKNFKSAIAFINQVADIAENEGHHPDLHLQDFKKVRVVLWTHAVQGLTENDFIVAAKIDRLN